jgi:hypothetical protein
VSKHTVSVREIRLQIIEQVLASASGRGHVSKRLVYQYDPARNRTYWLVRFLNDGNREYAFETLAEAVDAYNEI